MELIVTYNRIFGNTFFGWTYHGEKIGKFRIWLYRLWNIVLVAILATMCYIAYKTIKLSKITGKYSETWPNNNATAITKINLASIIQMVSIVAINVQALLTSIYLILFGHKMLDVLFDDDDIVINVKFRQKVAILIIILVMGYSVTSATISTYSALSHSPSSNPFIFLIPLYFSNSTQLTIISFIAYKSLLVKYYLVENLNNNLDSIYNVVFKIDRSIKKLDRLISVYILFTLLTKQVYCVSAICQLAFDYNNTIRDSIAFMFQGLTSLTVLCYCCNLIPSSLAKLLDHLEPNIKAHTDRILTLQLRQLNDRIGFTAFGLFRVNANTFLSCLGLITTYSVIIIQTGS